MFSKNNIELRSKTYLDRPGTSFYACFPWFQRKRGCFCISYTEVKNITKADWQNFITVWEFVGIWRGRVVYLQLWILSPWHYFVFIWISGMRINQNSKIKISWNVQSSNHTVVVSLKLENILCIMVCTILYWYYIIYNTTHILKLHQMFSWTSHWPGLRVYYIAKVWLLKGTALNLRLRSSMVTANLQTNDANIKCL